MRERAAGRCALTAFDFLLNGFAAVVPPPSLDASSAISIRPSKLQLPRQVSSRNKVKAGGVNPAHAPSGGAASGNCRFTEAAASSSCPCLLHVRLRMLRLQLLLLLLLLLLLRPGDCRVRLLLQRARRRGCWMWLLLLLFLRQMSHRQGWIL